MPTFWGPTRLSLRALLPALAWSVYCFGWKALLLTAVSVVSCVFFEWAYRKAMKKSCMVGDLSAVVTGILLSFVCPVDLPWWVIIIGAPRWRAVHSCWPAMPHG